MRGGVAFGKIWRQRMGGVRTPTDAAPPTHVARDQSEEDTAGSRERDADHPDLEGDPGAVQEAAEDIAPELALPEPVGVARRREPLPNRLLQRIVRCDERPNQRDEEEKA